VFGAAGRLMAGWVALCDRSHVQAILEWDEPVEDAGYDEDAYAYATSRTCRLSVWVQPRSDTHEEAVLGTANVRLTVTGGLIAATGIDEGTLLVTNTAHSYAWRFHGETVANIIASLLPDILARQAADELVGVPATTVPLPTWAELT